MSKQEIEQFLAEKQIAFVGVSRQKSKFGNSVYQKLKESGFILHPMHPEMGAFEGDACVTGVGQLPREVQALMLVASPEVCVKVLGELSQSKINRVWIFSGATRADLESDMQRLRDSGVSVISGRCPLMFVEPVGSVHAFHRFFSRLFGRYPQ